MSKIWTFELQTLYSMNYEWTLITFNNWLLGNWFLDLLILILDIWSFLLWTFHSWIFYLLIFWHFFNILALRNSEIKKFKFTSFKRSKNLLCKQYDFGFCPSSISTNEQLIPSHQLSMTNCANEAIDMEKVMPSSTDHIRGRGGNWCNSNTRNIWAQIAWKINHWIRIFRIQRPKL